MWNDNCTEKITGEMEDLRKQINRGLLFMMGITLVCGQLCENCVSNCAEDTGVCSGNCSLGWDGPTCSRRNVAFKQNTTQSSDYKSYSSSLVVDGGIGHQFHESPPTCSHTVRYPQPAFWTVTLDSEYHICRFRIYNRDENFCGGPCGARLNGFTLSVGNSSSQSYNVCYQDNTKDLAGPGAVIDGVCNVSGPVLGDTVRIMINNSRPLSLCEVQIFVCTPGTYGPYCENRCGNCAEGPSVCDSTSGHCPQRTPRCMLGYSGQKCDTECTKRSDCLERCGKCYSITECSSVPDASPVVKGNPRCDPGYSGSDCMAQLSTNSPDYTGVIIGCSVGIHLALIMAIIIVVIMKIPRNIQTGDSMSSQPNSTQSQENTIPYEVVDRSQTPEPSSVYNTCHIDSHEDHSYEAIRH